MRLTRRTFIKASAATAATVGASRVLFGGLGPLGAAGNGAALGATGAVDEWVPTTCWIGKQDCGILAHTVNGRVVKLEGLPAHPRNRGTLCPKGTGQIAALYDPNRVKTPLIRTNEKGVSGKFRPASWDEALGLVADAMNEVRERDPRLLIWQKGRSKAKAFYDTAFVKASGATKLHHGAFCSDAGYRVAEYTVGPHGVMHPDFRHTQYVLAWGWNITSAGGNKTCWLTWNQQLIEARERGVKVTVIDPRVRAAGPYADRWLAIRPTTDLALTLALCNLIIERGSIDWEYLKKHTNSGYLVQEDGHFLRVDGVEQVWDEGSGGPKAHDAEGVTPVLEGAFTVDGQTVRPAYQVFKEHVSGYTAEWAADVCGLDPVDIRKVASDLADNAMIGSTVVIDGVEVPYRPVSIMTYHVAQTELGFQQVRAQIMLMMLLGAMGAAGGTLVDWTWKVHKNFK
ncbi:MAG: molybdopterin-dependent oxidoreductase, partial [Dehalococcoidia bacterium]